VEDSPIAAGSPAVEVEATSEVVILVELLPVLLEEEELDEEELVVEAVELVSEVLVELDEVLLELALEDEVVAVAELDEELVSDVLVELDEELLVAAVEDVVAVEDVEEVAELVELVAAAEVVADELEEALEVMGTAWEISISNSHKLTQIFPLGNQFRVCQCIIPKLYSIQRSISNK
jgi:hypothetical protein